jgi:hypothetical protein
MNERQRALFLRLWRRRRFGLAWRVYGMQEAQHQALLAQGASAPAARPQLRFRTGRRCSP